MLTMTAASAQRGVRAKVRPRPRKRESPAGQFGWRSRTTGKGRCAAPFDKPPEMCGGYYRVAGSVTRAGAAGVSCTRPRRTFDERTGLGGSAWELVWCSGEWRWAKLRFRRTRVSSMARCASASRRRHPKP